jgi:hypothetical protein
MAVNTHYPVTKSAATATAATAAAAGIMLLLTLFVGTAMTIDAVLV